MAQASGTESDILGSYFRDLDRLERLDPEQERQIARQIELGDTAAIDRLVESNLGFVVRVAKEFRNKGLPLEDLVNEGNLGLIEAARRFDGRPDNKFVSYAVYWIRRLIIKALQNDARTVRIPANYYRRLQDDLRVANSSPAAPHRVRRRTQVSIEHPAPLSRQPSVTALHLDQFMADGSTPLANLLADDEVTTADNQMIRQEEQDRLLEAMEVLDDLELNVIFRRFGLDREAQTLQEIGDQLGVTREWVRQLELRAVKKLRRRMLRGQRVHRDRLQLVALRRSQTPIATQG